MNVFDYFRMWLIKVPIRDIRRNLLAAENAGAPLEPRQLETLSLANGRIDDCTLAWIRASTARINICWEIICEYDLAGYDPICVVDQIIERGLYSIKPDRLSEVVLECKRESPSLAESLPPYPAPPESASPSSIPLR